MKMKTLMGLAMMVTALVAATANAAVPEVLTYRGQLSRTGGFAERGENLTLTFKIYDSAAPATVLWGRSVVTSVDSNGVFYAELKDDNGAAVQGATHTALVDAVAAAKGVIEVGLTPPGAGEITPRQTLTTGVRAARAARTKAVDVFYAQNRIMAQGAAIDELMVNSITVTNGTAQLPPVCYLAPVAEQSLGGGKGTVTIKGLSPARAAWPYAPASKGCYTIGAASCDMALTYENDEGAFSVLLPKGCKVEGSSATQARTVNATAFGKAN
jgi:nitrogen fixation protein FixH